jgi:hypothetical protein
MAMSPKSEVIQKTKSKKCTKNQEQNKIKDEYDSS